MAQRKNTTDLTDLLLKVAINGCFQLKNKCRTFLL